MAKCIVIGAINMDIRGFGERSIVMGDSNPGKVRMSPGGVGRNIAHNLSLLGERPELLTALSDDFFGRGLEASCREAGIGLSLAVRPADARTGTYLYVTGPDHDLFVGISDTEIAKHIDAKLIRTRLKELNEACATVIDGNLTEDTLRCIASEVKSPLFADPVSRAKGVKLLPVLDRIHTIKPNRFEAEAMTGEDRPERAAHILREKGVKNVYVSCGREGTYVSSDMFEGMLPAFPADVRNTTGAGDAMTAGLIKAYLAGMDSRAAALFSMAAASIAAESEENIEPDLSYERVL
ncbi:MAG: MarR family transcriptional regulator [Lachnospiraceae bacterium]|nr:MarR family transcriptional regulator [Lachnospiraceae bacterium]